MFSSNTIMADILGAADNFGRRSDVPVATRSCMSDRVVRIEIGGISVDIPIPHARITRMSGELVAFFDRLELGLHGVQLLFCL